MNERLSRPSPDHMTQALDAASGGCLPIFALVDGALLLDLPARTRRYWATLQHQSLLTDVSDDVAAVGPQLYPVTTEYRARDLPSTLCDRATGRIAGSFIASDREPRELARVLSSFVDVQLSDGTDMVMRYFDPRVLPFWIDLLRPDYRRYLARAVVNWTLWRHDFELQTTDIDRAGEDLTPPELPMKLAMDAENVLLDACAPFTMIERMRIEDATALERIPASQRYEFFRNQIKRGTAHGLSSQGELEAYCGMAIEFGAAFDEDRKVHAALAGIKRSQSFDEALSTITNKDWNRIRGNK